jgi:hypothetical protein
MSAELLLGASSDFWKNHFEDYEAVKALVEGVFSSVAESYRTLSAGTVSRSIDSVPTRIRRKYRVLPVRGNSLLIKRSTDFNTGITYAWYILECPDSIRTIPSIISNVSDSPTTSLIHGEDYALYSGSGFVLQQMFQDDSSWINPDKRYILFKTNPLEMDGAQKSKVLVQDYYKMRVLEGNPNWADSLSVGDELIVGNSGSSRVLYVDETEGCVYLDPTDPAEVDTTRLRADGGAIELQVSSELFYLLVPTVYLVAHNCQEDPGYMHSNYGFRYFDSQQVSSEYLRKVIKGITLLRTAPPTKETLLSAIHLILGLPVFEANDEVGEFLIESISQPNSGNTLVRTSLATYVVPSGVSIRQEIQDGLEFVDDVPNENVTEYEINRLDPICDGVEIFTDTSAEWWYDESLVFELPENVAPGLVEQLDRKIISGTHDNIVGSPQPFIIPEQRVGDYHFEVGDVNRRVLATALTEDFLKWKLVGVKFSQQLYDNWNPLFSQRDLLVKALQDALPVGTLLITNL